MKLAILALITFLTAAGEANAGSCGAGCQRAMGSCVVGEGLWAALQNARANGITATSCCRSPAYNRQLRSCGYFPSSSSAHMSGNAVDIIISPRYCTRRGLAPYGFTNVCPLYHYGHCHVSKCGSGRSYQRAVEQTRAEAARIRQAYRRRPMRAEYVTPYTPRSEPTVYYYQAPPAPVYNSNYEDLPRWAKTPGVSR